VIGGSVVRNRGVSVIVSIGIGISTVIAINAGNISISDISDIISSSNINTINTINTTINTITIHHIPRTHRTIQNLQGTLLPIARVNTRTHHRHIAITQRQLR